MSHAPTPQSIEARRRTLTDWAKKAPKRKVKAAHIPLGAMHDSLYLPGKHKSRAKRLVVSFERQDGPEDSARPALMSFAQAQGWSVLGLLAQGPTWFRAPEVAAHLSALANDGFFAGFDQIVLIGASMGGYAACAYAALVPGADVIAIAPQATLDRDDTAWESRFVEGRRQDFGGATGYAPEQLSAARKVWLFYDPRFAPDMMHAALFRGPNICKIRCFYMGHSLLEMWSTMGIATDILTACLGGTAKETSIYGYLRARHQSEPFCRRVLAHMTQEGNQARIAAYCKAVLKHHDSPPFHNHLLRAEKLLAAQAQ